MENVTLIKIGGVSAVLVPVMFIAAGVLFAVFGVPSFPEEPGELEAWARSSTDSALVPGGFAAVLLVKALLVPVAFGFYAALRREVGQVLWIAIGATILGSVFLSGATLIDVVLAAEVAPRYLEASEASRPALAAFAFTLHGARDIVRAFGDVVGLGVGMGLFALTGLRTTVVRKWIGWLGLVGILLAGWLPPLEPVSEAFKISFSLGLPLVFVWLIAMGVTLLRLPPSADPRESGG